MTYPEPPDSLNTAADHRSDARASGDWDRSLDHADMDQPTARELAEMEADGW